MTLQHLPELLRTALMSHQKHIIILWLTAISIRTTLDILCFCVNLTGDALFMQVLHACATYCLANWSLLSMLIENGLCDFLCIIYGMPMHRMIQKIRWVLTRFDDSTTTTRWSDQRLSIWIVFPSTKYDALWRSVPFYRQYTGSGANAFWDFSIWLRQVSALLHKLHSLFLSDHYDQK